MDRFHNSLPSRFLFALNAGIPIVMPKGYFLACEEFVKKYEIGFTYNSPTDLKEALSDDNLMTKYRKNAIEKAENFVYEKSFPRIDNLMKAAMR
jgi:hypothetical protein